MAILSYTTRKFLKNWKGTENKCIVIINQKLSSRRNIGTTYCHAELVSASLETLSPARFAVAPASPSESEAGKARREGEPRPNGGKRVQGDTLLRR
ncbi:MAG: hypothetical protein QME51_07860 [Planctomycetota bacterium]|nr:hypothetical protein [Planctomycetota bacterium]